MSQSEVIAYFQPNVVIKICNMLFHTTNPGKMRSFKPSGHCTSALAKTEQLSAKETMVRIMLPPIWLRPSWFGVHYIYTVSGPANKTEYMVPDSYMYRRLRNKQQKGLTYFLH